MRTQTTAESTLLASNTYGIHQRVKIANGSATLIDLSAWVEEITIDEDIDQPTAQATIELRRDSGSTLSLAPLRTDSTLNRLNDGVSYSPQLDAGRLITIEVATVAIGSTPASADWKEIFRGYLDSTDASKPTVTVVARDLGSVVVDRWIEVEDASYGSAEAGVDISLQTVMQQLLDNTLGAGVITLAIEGTPLYAIHQYKQASEPLMDALRTLANDRGWDVRYKWNGTTWAFTLYEPPRSKTTPDRTFGVSMYYDVTRLMLDRADVRNKIVISFRNSAVGNQREDVPFIDSASQTRYGIRFFGITLGDDSAVDTVAEVTALGNAALSDLKDPKAEQEIEAQFFWPAQLSDLYRFSANGTHYNTDQDWAVTNVRHHLWGGTGRTYLQVRGTPAGGYLTWLEKGGSTSADDVIAIDRRMNIQVARSVGTAEQGWSEEGRTRSQGGGMLTRGSAYDTNPWYDETGASLLLDPSTAQIGTGLKYPTGAGIDALRPAEAGANVTETRTANDVLVGAGKSVLEVGANKTETRVSADTAAVDGTVAATVKGGAVRANTGLSATGLVALDVPRVRAAAELPAISTGTGLLLDTVAVSGKPTVYPVATDDNVSTLANGATVEDGATRAREGLVVATGVVAKAVPLAHAAANIPGVDLPTGKVKKATTFETGEAQAGLRDAGRVAGTAAQGWGEEGRTRGGSGGLNMPGARIHADALYDATGAIPLIDPATLKTTASLKVDKDAVKDTGERLAGLRDTGRAAGTAAQGWTEEDRQRGGNGGVGAERYTGEPLYDATGALLLLDTTTRRHSNATLDSTTALDGPTGVIGAGTSQTLAGTARAIVKGYQSGYVKDGSAVTYSPVFQNVPGIRLTGGKGPGGTYPYELFSADSHTASGFTCRARNKNKGTVTARVAEFTASLTVDTVGATVGPATLASGASVDSNYKVRFQITVVCTTPTEEPTGTSTVVVAIEVSVDGTTGWTEYATISKAVSRTTSGTTTTVYSGQEKTVTVSGLTTASKIRLKLKSITYTGGAGGTPTLEGYDYSPTSEGHGVEYTTATGSTDESKTPDADDYINWEAFEVTS